MKTSKTIFSLHNGIITIGITLCCILSSCHSSKFYMARNVNVQTEPNATLFWENGGEIATADDGGQAVIAVSEYMYRKGYKNITAAKAGYEPQTIALQKKFNKRVLYNLISPLFFIFGHFSTVDFNKTNTVALNALSATDARSYLSMANQESSMKKKTDLLRNALYQDPENEHGVAIVCVNALSDLYYQQKAYEESLSWAEYGTIIDPENADIQKKYMRAETAIAARAERKRIRRENAMNILSAVSAGVSTVAANYPSAGSVGGVTVGSSTRSSGSGHNYQRQYDIWAKQAENRYNSLKNPSSSGRVNQVDLKYYHKAQREMNNIRIKAAHAGKSIQQSPYETLRIN